ncbi:unnamed protein product [Tetraodon nigroviridis]|uniref:Tripartite motif-containing protein 54 n=1 Tax=Tetraodon nigroviridis TaxID=99883 RepID=Q4SZL6_TETNG|nr:unnamed protein product [Tetraodon nigroviridis]
MNFALGCKPPSAGSSGPGAPRGTAMENLEKQLVCPVCLEMFSKPVVILPCQHNLCRKCASDIFQEANHPGHSRGSSAAVLSGSRFRCPSCRHEVVLDRHGIYGLQRNLLVENIIDVYRQQEAARLVAMKPEQPQQLLCEDHEDEKINIYCLSCQTPTCSMCKVFGKHKDCDVAPLDNVYSRTKTELSDGIAVLVASNDHVQEHISQMEDMCRTIEENGKQQREQLAGRFYRLVATLEERKQELVGLISKEQDHKLKRARSLLRRYREQLEAAVALVESAIRSMEEPHMSAFIQSANVILERMAAASRTSSTERPELGYENMNHFTVDTEEAAAALQSLHFCSGVEDDEEAEEDSEVNVPSSSTV